MMLLTQVHKKRLIANGQNRGDHVPVVKFFSPVGAATWLLSELDDDGDTLFSLADLGFGCSELGSVSLTEIASVTLPFGLSIERDIHFEAGFPLTVYAVLTTPPVKARQTPHSNPAVRTTGPASTATPVCNGSGANHQRRT